MAWDLLSGETGPRDWSIDAGTEPAGSPKGELWSREQIVGLGELVAREVENNAAVAGKRGAAGTLPKTDAEAFGKFVGGWRAWRSREMGRAKILTGRTVDALKKWRSENAAWTVKLSETSRKEPVAILEMVRIDVVTVPKKKPEAGRVQWIVGAILGAIGLSFLLSRQ